MFPLYALVRSFACSAKACPVSTLGMLGAQSTVGRVLLLAPRACCSHLVQGSAQPVTCRPVVAHEVLGVPAILLRAEESHETATHMMGVSPQERRVVTGVR